jgi:hypothetical protein
MKVDDRGAIYQPSRPEPQIRAAVLVWAGEMVESERET